MWMLAPTGTLSRVVLVSMTGLLASHTRFKYTRVVRTVLIAHIRSMPRLLSGCVKY